MIDHLRGPGFFTMVVASSIPGSALVVLTGSYRMGGILASGDCLWIGLTYAIFAAFTIKQEKPSLDKGINDGWLLAEVATQSMAVPSALLAVRIGQPYKLALNFFALSMWPIRSIGVRFSRSACTPSVRMK
ncbi:MAG: hypothetical protein R3E34_11535 [Rhodocyclaceae bacterium]